MKRRLGVGEFERIDVDVRSSQWDRREMFLRTLMRRRSSIFDELFSIANISSAGAESLASLDEKTRFFLFFTYSFRNNPYNLPITDSNWLDTPLQHYFALIDSNKLELECVESWLETEGFADVGDSDLRRIAIYEMIPGWTSLKQYEGSGDAVSSIERWAIRYNLNEAWILDFVLLALNRQFCATERRNLLVDLESLSREMMVNTFERFWSDVRESLSSGVWDFHSINISANMHRESEHLKIKEFVFSYRGFISRSTIWFPYIDRRSTFIEAYKSWFWGQVEAQRSLMRDPRWSEAEVRHQLAEYWQASSISASEKSKAFISPYVLEYDLVLTVVACLWDPLVSQEKFVQTGAAQFRESLAQYAENVRKLDGLSKSRLDQALRNYCKEVIEQMPPNYAKTPGMNKAGAKHFDWLIEYQLPPGQSYRQIAQKSEGRSPQTWEAVKIAVNELVANLGMTLRPGGRGGRPKGVKEEGTRLHRVQK